MFRPGSERGNVQNMYVVAIGEHAQRSVWAGLFRVIRDRVERAASSVKSAMPPKGEVDSEQLRLRHRPLLVDGVAVDLIQAPKPEPRIMRDELSDYEWTAMLVTDCALATNRQHS
jgi:hypothetical protein